MGIAYRASAQVVGTAVSSIDISAPAGVQPNDMLLLHVAVSETPTLRPLSVPTGTSGWVQVAPPVAYGGSATTAVYRRVAQPGDSQWTITIAGGTAKLAATITAWSGVDTTSPIGATGREERAGNTTTVSAPSVLTSAANCVVVVAASDRTSTTAAITDPAGVTRRAAQFGSGAGSVSSYQASFMQAAPGATPVKTITFDVASANAVGHQVVLMPATTTTPPPATTSTTLDTLVWETLGGLNSWTTSQEQVTYLTADAGASDLVLTVADAAQVSTGLIEVDDELMYVLTPNKATNQLTIAPWGRGQEGTMAAAHLANAKVTVAPRYPRRRVINAVNQTIQALWPSLYEVAQTDITFVAAQYNYTLPADAHRVLRVSWRDTGPSDIQMPIGRWREDTKATGLGVEIFTPVIPGQPIRVLYAKTPSVFTASTQTLTDIGVPESARDIIVFGACARLLGYLESARLQSSAVETSARANEVPVGGAVNAARFFWQLYNQRLTEEREQLLRRYPPQSHFQR